MTITSTQKAQLNKEQMQNFAAKIHLAFKDRVDTDLLGLVSSSKHEDMLAHVILYEAELYSKFNTERAQIQQKIENIYKEVLQ